MAERVIFHVDANSAFLSWSAAYRVKVLGEELDLRTVPSVVAGDKESRHSIILAKSGPAKKYHSIISLFAYYTRGQGRGQPQNTA